MTDTKNINKKDQLAEYIGDSMEHPLVMIFTAKWHSHSDIVEIIAEKIMAADDKIRLIIIDADVDEDLFGVYNISSIPAAIIIKNKQMIKKINGTFSKKMILDCI
jgi:thioredoxin-like negative regulator of GroEL